MKPLSPNALKVLEKRYLCRNNKNELIENPEQLFSRVAKFLASVENTEKQDEWEEKFFAVLSNLDFVPSSPILKNSATTNGLMACYTLTVQDNMAHIMQSITDAAMIIKQGGGVGFSLSKLRPKDALIKSTHGKAMGPVAVMEFANELGNMMTQSGFRKAAMMAILRIDHPDIFEFMDCKIKEGKLKNFNISVAITDEFMESVENDKDFSLKDPRDGKIVSTIKAKDLWDKLIDSAWKLGDPGVIFIDTINKKDPLQKHAKIEGTNPCLGGESLVLTSQGLQKIKNLVDENFTILAGDNKWRPSKAYKTGEKEIFELKLSNGIKFWGTADHLINITADFAELADTAIGEIQNQSRIATFRGHPTWQGVTLNHNFATVIGFMFGDGWVQTKTSLAANIDYTREGDIIDFIRNYVYKSNYKYNYNMQSKKLTIGKCASLVSWVGTKGKKTWQKEIPATIFQLDPKTLGAWLKGLFSANGSVIASESIRVAFKTTSLNIVEGLQQLLLALGIKSYYTTNKKHDVKFKNGTYECKESYDLNITSKEDLYLFYTKIGFVHKKKQQKLKQYLPATNGPRKNPAVAYIRSLGIQPVYDFSEPITNHGWVQGLMAHNCSESPLLDRESCITGEAIIPTDLGDVKLAEVVTRVNQGETIKVLTISGLYETITKAKSQGFQKVWLVEFNDGTVVKATKEHLFKTKYQGWQQTSALRPRDIVEAWNCAAKEMPVAETKIVMRLEKLTKKEEVFDLEEPITHTFVANRVVVHNCDLGSINLTNFVEEQAITYNRLEEVVKTGVRLLDNVIDASVYPTEEIENNTKASRKIGLGIMGLADALALMHIPYASEQGIKTAGEIMKFISDTAMNYSRELAEEKGEFPLYSKSNYKKKIRNATHTALAPTGSIAIIADTSYGCEPLFKLAFKKNILDGDPIIEISKSFKTIAEVYGFWNKEVEDFIIKNGSCQGCSEIPKKWQRIFLVANEIKPDWHLRMQASLQEHIGLGVSKTVALPNSATKQDVAEIYQRAYNNELKGITIYREGSRQLEVVTSINESKVVDKFTKTRKRPEVAQGFTHQIGTGCGNMLVNLTQDEEGYVDVVAQIGKSGACSASFLEAIGRLISIALRSNVDPAEVLKQIKGIRCPRPLTMRKDPILSCADALAKSLEKLMDLQIKLPKNVEKAITIGSSNIPGTSSIVVGQCPDCNSPLIYTEGCSSCSSCSYMRCG